MSQRNCNYCGTLLIRFTKDDATGKWHRYDTNNNEHTFAACKAIQNNKQIQPAKIAAIKQGDQITRYYPNNPPPTQPSGININSVYIKASNAEKEVKELRKQIETLANIVDGMAQNITLLVQKVGYPEPRRVTAEDVERKKREIDEQFKEMLKEKEEIIEPENVESNSAFLETQIKIKKELAKDAAEEEEEDKTSSSSSKKVVWDENGNIKRELDRVKEDLAPPVEIKQGWTLISERFICHGCEGTKFNGYEQWGTKLCDECKTNIDAQEALDKINAEPEKDERHQHLRTIEDVNEEGSEML